MKLPGAVMDAVRGLGGAALIAAATVGGTGCGGATQSGVVTVSRVPVVNASTNQQSTPQTPHDAQVTAPPYDPEPDWAAACGRG